MPKRITKEQRDAVLHLLVEGHDRNLIAEVVGVTPGQVSAVSAHVKMGTYSLPDLETRKPNGIAVESRAAEALKRLEDAAPAGPAYAQAAPVLLGDDVETGDPVYWNPDPASGLTNPHVLIVGESGSGKTYAICCLLAELARQGVVSIVFDYGQGFSAQSLPPEFLKAVKVVELHASRDGIDLNPLQIFPSDVHGPVNVAQRVADTFARVYPKIGVQQHAILREAVLQTLERGGVDAERRDTWHYEPPAFNSLHDRLNQVSANETGPSARYAASVASHVATLFFFNTLRPNGQKVDWEKMLGARGVVFVIQLKGLELSLERAITEFLLWNLIGFIESSGPGPLKLFVVLDEAHKVSFDAGSPVEKMLREGRKFGLGAILASQQLDDFSQVASGNTATKLVFQVADERSTISRQLHRKVKDAHSFGEIYQLITKLPRGCAYVVTENIGRVVRVASFRDRVNRWVS